MIDITDKKSLENIFAQDFGSPYFPILADLYLQEGDFRRAKTVKLRTSVVDKVGFSRCLARRALKQLESAGLIKTEPKPGQLTTVRILNVEV